MVGADDIIDGAILKVRPKHDKLMRGFYDILRDKVNSRLLENKEDEKELLEWVLIQIDVCEQEVKTIIESNIVTLREEMKKTFRESGA